MKNNKKEFDSDKIKITLLKIKELSEKGYDDERQVAINKLELLLKKYNLSIDDLMEEKKKFEIKYSSKPDAKTILAQVIWSVIPKAKIYEDTKRLRLYTILKSDEYIEIIEKNKYFFDLYQKERKKFLISFCLKNKLFNNNESSPNSESKYSKEEIRQIFIMSGFISKGEYISTKKILPEKSPDNSGQKKTNRKYK